MAADYPMSNGVTALIIDEAPLALTPENREITFATPLEVPPNRLFTAFEPEVSRLSAPEPLK
jgi:hypothetical protein